MSRIRYSRNSGVMALTLKIWIQVNLQSILISFFPIVLVRNIQLSANSLLSLSQCCYSCRKENNCSDHNKGGFWIAKNLKNLQKPQKRTSSRLTIPAVGLCKPPTSALLTS
ncbi:unnamed protein product [Moneuplotes crassus]|uniref:Uncharacterized protein n=1 Tax=Euplotes crassus TaxID=5936 RepID=A0AAD1Y5U9_EUPCR|nr:unnamed protein product [Moneuplotes crassus]